MHEDASPVVKFQVLSVARVSGGLARSLMPAPPLFSTAVYNVFDANVAAGWKLAIVPVAASTEIELARTGTAALLSVKVEAFTEPGSSRSPFGTVKVALIAPVGQTSVAFESGLVDATAMFPAAVGALATNVHL